MFLFLRQIYKDKKILYNVPVIHVHNKSNVHVFAMAWFHSHNLAYAVINQCGLVTRWLMSVTCTLYYWKKWKVADQNCDITTLRLLYMTINNQCNDAAKQVLLKFVMKAKVHPAYTAYIYETKSFFFHKQKWYYFTYQDLSMPLL